MILKSLEDLENYKNNIKIPKSFISIKDINEVEIGGGESTNIYNNKLFYWNFEPYYIEDLVSIYEKVKNCLINNGKLCELELELKLIAQKMINENTCPIESILYASKTVNNLLITNNYLIKRIGKVIASIYSKNPSEYKETIKFILNEWSWYPQMMILISACGEINDIELFDILYKKHTKGEIRLQTLKAFMNGKNDICIDYALKLIISTKESDNTEVQMAKYFIHNYVKCFGVSAIKKAEYYLDTKDINNQARKVISRIIPNSKKNEIVTLDDMIKKAKNWNIEDDFENCFLTWMNDDLTRKNAFLAIRYSNSSKIEEMILYVLKTYKCNSIEIGTALLTLAQWSSRKGCSKELLNLITENKNDITKKVYCNAAMCSLGEEKDSEELIKEFLEEKYYNSRQIFSIIRDCAYKSNQLLRYSIKKVYEEYLCSDDEEKIIKAINGAYELCDKPKFNFKNITLEIIKDEIGINKNINKKFSDKVYTALINLVEKLLNDKNKDDFIDILFFIIENEECSQKIKSKSIIMLKRLSVDPPK